jgi:hypothetical protein
MLGSILNTAAAVFTSPKVPHSVFLDEEAKGEGDALGAEGDVKRVELKIGGMTVSWHAWTV